MVSFEEVKRKHSALTQSIQPHLVMGTVNVAMNGPRKSSWSTLAKRSYVFLPVSSLRFKFCLILFSGINGCAKPSIVIHLRKITSINVLIIFFNFINKCFYNILSQGNLNIARM